MKIQKIILLKDILNKGKKYDILLVKPGYARNYLIPKNIAFLVNLKNINFIKYKYKKLIFNKYKKYINLLNKALFIKNNNIINIKSKTIYKNNMLKKISVNNILYILNNINIFINQKEIILLKNNINTLGKHNIIIKLSNKIKIRFFILIEKYKENYYV